MKTEEMRYLIIRAASYRTLATPSCSEGCLSQEIYRDRPFAYHADALVEFGSRGLSSAGVFVR